nr:hypothetical protein [Catenovulum agarivorans]
MDGEWGAGKTYYVEHTLIPAVKNKTFNLGHENIVYLSVFGLENLADFRDKLVSATYFSDKVDTGFVEKLKEAAFGVAKSIDTENTSLVGSLLQSSSGAIKHAMLSKLRDYVVVVDDLERLENDNLQKGIIGECLNLAEENKLAFIFVVNASRLKLHNTFLEKTFAGKVKLSCSYESAFDITFERTSNLHPFKTEIVRFIEKFELKNLRILQRISFKLNQIYELVKDCNEIDIQKTIEFFAKDLIRISYLHSCCNKSPSEIEIGFSRQKRVESHIRKKQNQSPAKETDEPEDIFIRFLDIDTPTKEMINFACGETHIIDDVHLLGRVFRKSDPVEHLLFNQYALFDEAFDFNLEKARKFIFEDDQVEIHRWFEACEQYVNLIEWRFVEEYMEEYLAKIERFACRKKFYRDKNFKTYRINHPKIVKLFKKHSGLLESETQRVGDQQLFEQIKTSWQQVDQTIYNEHRLTPFLNKYPAEEWKLAFSGWSNLDKGYFCSFILERYDPSNIANYLKDELPTLQGLAALLASELDKMPQANQQKGVMTRVKLALDSAIEKLGP